jgi:hypothetical protein
MLDHRVRPREGQPMLGLRCRWSRAKSLAGRRASNRLAAELSSSPTIKKQMLTIAARYERLAAQALDHQYGGGQSN